MDQFFVFLKARWPEILSATGEHLTLSSISLLAAGMVALPLGIFIARRPNWSGPVMGVANVIQTIPSVALLGFMIPVLGIGNVPSAAALALYALLPLLVNTYTGIIKVDPAILEAARGMGMTPRQMLWMVELPLALPVILNGVRTAAVGVIAWATLAAIIGGGGLGQLIVRGLARAKPDMILAGAIPAILLALVVDYGLGGLERRIIPRGIRS